MNVPVLHGLLFVALTSLAASANADSVKGAFTLEGKPPVKPVAVAAFRTPAKDTLVLLTGKPLNRERIAASSDPESAAVNDEAVRGTDYLEFVVSADGQVSLNANVGGTQYLESTKMELVATCSTNTAEHVACSVKTKKVLKFKNEPGWSVDITFDAAISHPAR
jgi:hypothetical protein